MEIDLTEYCERIGEMVSSKSRISGKAIGLNIRWKRSKRTSEAAIPISSQRNDALHFSQLKRYR